MTQASAETLEHTGPAEKKRVASVLQREQLGSTPEPFAKRKRNKAIRPDHQIVKGKRVRVSESCTLAIERGIRAGAWRGNDKLHIKGKQVSRR